ncbi:MAG: LysR family transcriptional regulator [Myxococcales bacterium]|nr:LysR family transcriptional regulator [Myxococcales bacterium]
MFSTTLEQWLVLQSVVELGSVAKAAKYHHKSQPAISYQLTQLQERLGVELLRLEGRKLVLTSHGAILLDEASRLIEGWKYMESKAAHLKSGARTIIRLVVDVLYPRTHLFRVLKQFNQMYPYTQIHVREVIRKEGIHHFEEKTGDVYIINLSSDQLASSPKRLIKDIRMMLVAHHEHPIFQLEEQHRSLQIAGYPMIQIVDKESQQQKPMRKTHHDSWYVTTVDSAIEAVTNGLSLGWLPEDNIRLLLEEGTLQPIQSSTPSERVVSLYLIKSIGCQYDPSIQALSTLLSAELT